MVRILPNNDHLDTTQRGQARPGIDILGCTSLVRRRRYVGILPLTGRVHVRVGGVIRATDALLPQELLKLKKVWFSDLVLQQLEPR